MFWSSVKQNSIDSLGKQNWKGIFLPLPATEREWKEVLRQVEAPKSIHKKKIYFEDHH